nr:uncharacterized protein LOC128704793 isoform X1 [Cherax quadricarinatus]
MLHSVALSMVGRRSAGHGPLVSKHCGPVEPLVRTCGTLVNRCGVAGIPEGRVSGHCGPLNSHCDPAGPLNSRCGPVGPLVDMVCIPGPVHRTSCTRCCHLRRKQRILAVLSASTGLSLLLLVLHSSSTSYALQRVTPLENSKDLPEKSQYFLREVIETPKIPRNPTKQPNLKPSTSLSDTKSHKNSDFNSDYYVNVNRGYRNGFNGTHAVKQKGFSLKRVNGRYRIEEYKRKGRWEERQFSLLSTGRRIDHSTGINAGWSLGETYLGINPARSLGGAYLPPGEHEGHLEAPEGPLPSPRGHQPLLLLYDYSRPSYYPWRTTRDECSNYATRFLVGGGCPLIPLVSFPGSGNTWLRYLVQTLTGVFTGSVYHDEVLALSGFLGERDGYRQGTTLLQKTHSYPLLPEVLQDGIYKGEEFRFLLPKAPRKVVILVRSPWESLLALRHYHAAGHTGFASSSYFRGTNWRNFTVERAEMWVSLNTAWLSVPNTDVHVLHYEHLQHGLEQEAVRLMEFLGLPLDYGRIDCLVRYPEGRFRRPKYPKHLQGYRFPARAIQILQDGMDSINTILGRGGHPVLPVQLYGFTPLPLTSGDMPVSHGG